MRRAGVADFAAWLKEYAGRRPGMQQKVARTFAQQPPVIPHAVANFDDINLEENLCLDCHGPAKYKEKKSPKIGDSHFRDRDGNKLTDVSALRHNCTQWHPMPRAADRRAAAGRKHLGNLKTAAKGKAKPLPGKPKTSTSSIRCAGRCGRPALSATIAFR